MRLLRRLVPAALLLASVAVPPQVSADPDPGIGALQTGNVQHLLTVPLDSDSAGGRVVGKDFFVRTAKGISVYDTSNPALPLLKGFVAVPQTPNQEREDIDTNGQILITGQAYTGLFHVVDVTNRTAPTVIATLLEGGNHTNTCVLSCRWSYGSEGSIIDLRVPTAPKLVGNWMRSTGVKESHDLTEVRPGLLLVASNPVTYLDARNPLQPKRLRTAVLPDQRYSHGVAWPRGGQDRFVLGGSESFYGCTAPEDGTFFVFDTRRKGAKGSDWRQTGDLTLTPGLQTEGRAQVSELCGHWFDPHPAFRDGGLVAMAWYGYGVRFLEVRKDGSVRERGWWVPLAGQSSAVYWVSPDTVWVTDYTGRGIDVLRFDAKAPSSAPQTRWQPFDPSRPRTAPAGHHSVAVLSRAWTCTP